MPEIPAPAHVLHALALLWPPLYTALEWATQQTRAYFDAERTPVDRHLAPSLVRYQAKRSVARLGHNAQEEECEAYAFQTLPNNGLSLSYRGDHLDGLRILKALEGQLPAPEGVAPGPDPAGPHPGPPHAEAGSGAVRPTGGAGLAHPGADHRAGGAAAGAAAAGGTPLRPADGVRVTGRRDGPGLGLHPGAPGRLCRGDLTDGRERSCGVGQRGQVSLGLDDAHGGHRLGPIGVAVGLQHPKRCASVTFFPHVLTLDPCPSFPTIAHRDVVFEDATRARGMIGLHDGTVPVTCCLHLEHLAWRHQLAVSQRSIPRPRLCATNRLFGSATQVMPDAQY
jgi:hypothetical protein